MTTLSDLLLLGTTLQTVPDPTNGGVQLPYPTSDHLVANLGKSIQALAEQLSAVGPGRLIALPSNLGSAAATAGGAAAAIPSSLAYPATPAGTLLRFDVSMTMTPSTATVSIVNFAWTASQGTPLAGFSRRLATPASGLAVYADCVFYLRSNGSAGVLSGTAQATSASAATTTCGAIAACTVA
jgi:hypothetical protein